MLVLSRRIGESIIIGDGDNEVRVTVLSVMGNQVRLGIGADKSIPVHREEIADRIKKDKENEND